MEGCEGNGREGTTQFHRCARRDGFHSRGYVGSPYRSVERLFGYAVGAWNEIDGALALQGGTGLSELGDLRRLLNVAYAHLTNGMDDDARKRVDEALTEIPLEEIQDEVARGREMRRREVRRRGIDQGPALAAMRGRQR